ncbi:MAG: hypothetical protein HQL36_01655 [Alphaproteobacteria bacterium]|nr:hypothetical protein [Alphaproteobacteria bacterium]
MKPNGETVGALGNDLRAVAERLRSLGRHGDTILAHITPEEAAFLHRATDGGTVNPATGLPEFFDFSGMFSDISKGISQFGSKVTENLSESFSNLKQGAGATKNMLDNYLDMRRANVKNSDKYFHCKGNCEATRQGPAGETVADSISNIRELWDQNVKGYPHSDSIADQRANKTGRTAAKSGLSCQHGCSIYRPRGLPPRY